MKTYKKDSLAYKLRAWIIVFLGILQVLHYIFLRINIQDDKLVNQIWFWMILAIVSTLFEIKDDFSYVRADGLIMQIFRFVISCLYIWGVFSGILVIIWQNRKGSIIFKGKKDLGRKNKSMHRR